MATLIRGSDEKLRNVDFWFGREIAGITNYFNDKYQHRFKDGQIYNMAVALIALEHADNAPIAGALFAKTNLVIKDYVCIIKDPDVHRLRKFADCRARLIEALEFYYSLVRELRIKGQEYEYKNGSKLTAFNLKAFRDALKYFEQSSPFMAFILIDFLGDAILPKQSIGNLAITLLGKASKFHEEFTHYQAGRRKNGQTHDDFIELVSGNRNFAGRQNVKVRSMLGQ